MRSSTQCGHLGSTGYFDQVRQAITGNERAATAAMAESTEVAQLALAV